MAEKPRYFATVTKSFVDAPYASSFVAGAMGLGAIGYSIYQWLMGGPGRWEVAIVVPLATVVLASLIYLHGRQAWNLERSNVEQLEDTIANTHPRLEVIDCGIKHVDLTHAGDGPVPYRYIIAYAMRIGAGRRPAFKLTGRLVALGGHPNPATDRHLKTGH